MGGNKTPIIDQKALEDSREENWFVSYRDRLVSGETTPERESVPATVRRLTIKEAALLQIFPQGYGFAGRKTSQYKQIGNAAACNFARAVAGSVIGALS